MKSVLLLISLVSLFFFQCKSNTSLEWRLQSLLPEGYELLKFEGEFRLQTKQAVETGLGPWEFGTGNEPPGKKSQEYARIVILRFSRTDPKDYPALLETKAALQDKLRRKKKQSN